MGVSRLDNFALLNGRTANTTGAANSAAGVEAPLTNYPLNGLVSVIATGGFGGGTLVLEVTADGVNWAPPVTAPVSLTGPGVLVWQGTALGIRAKLTGATAATLTATAVFVEY